MVEQQRSVTSPSLAKRPPKGRYAARLRMNLKPTPKARELPQLWPLILESGR